MSNSFSFPVDPEASFVLERYLEELQQRILLEAACCAGRNLQASVDADLIYDCLSNVIEPEEGQFLNAKLRPLLEQEWKAMDKTQPKEKVSPPNPEP